MNHPTIWKLVDGMRRVQIGRDAAYEQMIRGEAPAKKRKKYVDADAQIKKLVVGYSQFLRSTNHRISSRHSQ